MIIDWESFVAHLVHDARGLARQSLLNAQLLEREQSNDPSQRYLSAIAASQQKLDRLLIRVTRLLDAVREDRAALWSDLQQLEVLLLGAKLEQKAALSEVGSELSIHDLPEVRLPAKLQAVFSELLHNAARFRDPARPLRIEVRGAMPESGLLRVSVGDNGLGWDGTYSGKLFQPFNCLHAGTGGFGLGLAICRVLVEAAGGRIIGESHAVGASFVIELPVSKD